MRRLEVSVQVRAPRSFALAYVWTYLQDRTSGAAGQLILELPLSAVPGGATVEKPVTVGLALHPDKKRIEIAWAPVETNAFPRFHGTFATTGGNEPPCTLTLSGEYDPPGGAAGAAFDSLLGYRIAQTTIETLLRQIASATDADYRLRLAL